MNIPPGKQELEEVKEYYLKFTPVISRSCNTNSSIVMFIVESYLTCVLFVPWPSSTPSASANEFR